MTHGTIVKLIFFQVVGDHVSHSNDSSMVGSISSGQDEHLYPTPGSAMDDERDNINSELSITTK